MEDVSLELVKVRSYADFLREEINKLSPDELGKFTLSREQVSAFGWMLEDIGTTIFSVNQAVNSDGMEGKQ